MLNEFLRKNKVDDAAIIIDDESTDEIENFIIEEYPTLHAIFKKIGGYSYEGGIFRMHTFGSSATWSNKLKEYFPEFGLNFYCFGYDWMGCMYAYSLDEEPTIYIFDPADMDTREAEATIEDFFNIDLVEYRNETLMLGKLKSVRKKWNVGAIDFDKCLGYKESLFLGGQDTDANFDIWDLEVYWELQHKIFFKIKDLPEGAEIGDINFEE